MSFALDYRKKLQDKERDELRLAKENAGFVTMPLDPDTDTRGNRRRVTLALLIAGGLLAVLNSAGLVNYAYNLADTRAGQMLVVASERWHGMMERHRTTQVVGHIRGSVVAIRETSWQDLKVVLNFSPEQPGDMDQDRPPVMPASSPQDHKPPQPQETVRPQKPKTPQGPVMRASADIADKKTR